MDPILALVLLAPVGLVALIALCGKRKLSELPWSLRPTNRALAASEQIFARLRAESFGPYDLLFLFHFAQPGKPLVTQIFARLAGVGK